MKYSETITIEDLDTDPFPHYARLRREDPIAPVPAANCWFATRWADVELIARHPDFTAVSDEAPVNAAFGRPNVLTSEGPTHAALRGGIKTVLIPEENEKDLPEIPDNVKAGLKIIPVRWIDQVLEHALVHQPVPLPDEAPLVPEVLAVVAADNPATPVKH